MSPASGAVCGIESLLHLSLDSPAGGGSVLTQSVAHLGGSGSRELASCSSVGFGLSRRPPGSGGILLNLTTGGIQTTRALIRNSSKAISCIRFELLLRGNCPLCAHLRLSLDAALKSPAALHGCLSLLAPLSLRLRLRIALRRQGAMPQSQCMFQLIGTLHQLHITALDGDVAHPLDFCEPVSKLETRTQLDLIVRVAGLR